MRFLVFGQSGQVAQELARRLPQGVSAHFLGRDQADLRDRAACAQAIGGWDAVINAAAYTAVDKAETDEATALSINAAAPAVMAARCAALDIPFLHISTDYVFNGAGTLPFAPDHPTGPRNAYGRTKLAGEEGVRAAQGRHLILRTSWVISAHGANFVKTMLRLGASRDSLNVVADQIGGPTPAGDIAEALIAAAQAMVQGAKGGTHHFSGAPDVSWADLARTVMREGGLTCKVNDIPTSAYPTPAVRPRNSRLDCSGFEAEFGIQRPDWQLGLRSILRELSA